MKKILLLISILSCTLAASAQTYPQISDPGFELGTGTNFTNWKKVAGKPQRVASVSLGTLGTIKPHNGSYFAFLETDTIKVGKDTVISASVMGGEFACTDSPSFLKFFMVGYVRDKTTPAPAHIVLTFRKSGATIFSRDFGLPSTADNPNIGVNWVGISAPIKYDAAKPLPDSVIVSFYSSFPVTGNSYTSFLAVDDLSFSKKNPASIGDLTVEPIVKLSDVSVYPNPANNIANLKYKTGELSHVSVELYDIAGRKVANLYEGSEGPGEHTLPINTAQFNNGIYFYRVMADGVVTTAKLIISK